MTDSDGHRIPETDELYGFRPIPAPPGPAGKGRLKTRRLRGIARVGQSARPAFTAWLQG
jgi:hypothetical protein